MTGVTGTTGVTVEPDQPTAPIRRPRGRGRVAGPFTRGSLARRVTASCLLVALVAVGVAALVSLRLVSITSRQVTAEVLAQQADVIAAQLDDTAAGPIRAIPGA